MGGDRGPGAGGRGRGRAVAFVVAGVVGALVLAEAGLRVWAYFLRDPVERYDLAAGTFALVPGVHERETGTIRINRDGFVGAELAPADAAVRGVRRVVALGDSCTFGEGDDRDTYPAKLGMLLEEEPGSAPGGRTPVEVVNAGVAGLDSGQALRRLRSRVLPLEPDVVTVYLGWNDLMKYGPIAQAGDAPGSGLARAIDRLWLVRGLRKLYGYHLRPRWQAPRTGELDGARPFRYFVPAPFERNLEAIVEAIRAAGAEPVLVTLPTRVRPGMDAGALRRAGIVFPYFVGADRVVDFVDLIDAYNAAIRRVARARGVPVADAAHAFAREGAGEGLFWDAMHLTPRGMERVARVLAPAVRDALGGAVVASRPRPAGGSRP